MEDTLGYVDAGPHAEAGVAHVEGLGVAERVAADVPAEDRLLAGHGALDGIEARTMRAAGTEHGRTHGELWHVVRRGDRDVAAEKCVDGCGDRLHGVLARGADVARELAANSAGDSPPAADVDEGALDHGVELLHAEDLVEPLEEVAGEPLGERERGAHAKHAGTSLVTGKVLLDVLVAHALRGDADARGGRSRGNHEVPCIVGELVGETGVALLDERMVLDRETREDDPARRVPHEALGLLGLPLVLVLDENGLVPMVDAGRGPDDDGTPDALRELEGVLHHLVGLMDRGGIEHGHLGEHAEGARVLLGLGRDGAGVVSHEDDHPALDPDVLEAHERVGCDVETHLLAGHERPGAAVGGTGRDLHAGLLVDRPLHVDVAGIPLGDGLEDLGRGRSRIPGHHVDPGGERAERHGLVSHQEFSVHGSLSPTRRARRRPTVQHDSLADALLPAKELC